MRVLVESNDDRNTWRAAGEVLSTLGNALLAATAVYAAALLVGVLLDRLEPPLGVGAVVAAPWLAVVAFALVCRSRGAELTKRARRGQSID